MTGKAKLAAVVLLASLAPAAADERCPTVDEAKEAVARWQAFINISDIWQVVGVEDFAFGQMTFGEMVRKDTQHYGNREVCPVRFDYAFSIVHKNGRRERKEHTGEIQYFYRIENSPEWKYMWEKA